MIEIHIQAETVGEYLAAIQALSTGLVYVRSSGPIWDDANAADAAPDAGPLPPTAAEDITGQTAADAGVAAEAAPPRRRRGRPSLKDTQAAPEATEAAHAGNGAAPAAPEAAHAGNGAAPAGNGADPFADEADPKPKQAALDLLRALYDRPGMPGKVNSLLEQYNVDKFSLIGDEHGPALLAQARKLEADNPA